MKLLKVLALVTAALCAAVFLFAVMALPPKASHLAAPPSPAPLLAGAFHVHTTRSDGTGTVEEIAAAARRAGLGFVIFTDHGDGTRPPDAAAYRSGVLCIDGVEISTSAGHYAAIGMRPSPYPLAGESRDVVEDVTRLGGFGIAAHPDSPKAALRWREWAAPFDGLEWLNADSAWRDEPRTALARVLLTYLFRSPESLASMLSRPEAALAHWDALTRQRRVVAVAAADAHARMGWHGGGDPYLGGMSVKAPSYESVFRSFSIRLRLDRPLTGRASVDAMTVRSALAGGHVYSTIDALAAPAVFDFTARSGSFSARAGDSLTLDGPVEIEAMVNAPTASVALLENGRQVAQSAPPLRYQAAERPAVFRVEVRLPSAPGNPPVPWIVSNPIYVGGFLAPRIERPRPPVTRSLPVAADQANWTVERRARSHAAVSFDRASAVQLAYALAPGAHDSPFAALAHPVSGLTPFDRLEFRASADRPMRLSVQCRLLRGDGDARWQRSVYVDQEARDVTVFLDDVRPVGPRSTWQPDLSKVNTLLFVVDTVNTKPGTAGWVRLENVRLGAATK
jgi:hypothetical protein